VRILAETTYPAISPSARVRVAQFAPFLEPHGIELRFRPMLTDREYTTLASQAGAGRKALTAALAAARAVSYRREPHDAVLVHRLRFLFPLPRVEPARVVDVYDFDDALFLGSISSVNRRFRPMKQEARRWVEYLRRSEVVLAGNAFLADRAREHARRVEVVPSCVEPESQPLHVHEENEQLTVGWIGSSTTSEYVREVLPVFERLNADHTRVKLVLVGATAGASAPWIEHRQWSLARERDDLASFDVGINPLPETEWARGKCGYKTLQYFSAGVPAITTPVGVNRELVDDKRGMLVETAEDWRRAIEMLVTDAGARREMGAAGRRFVEERFSYSVWAPTVAELMRSATER
jgi:glycosyltransferase involved in cell wall biosynthesis